MSSKRRLRDSGVEWLDKIPEHWRVARLTDHVRILNGFPFDSEFFSRDRGSPLVRIRDLFEAETEILYDGAIVEEALIDNGDIIVGMDGDFNVGRWNGGKALLNQRLCCLRTDGSVDPQFLFYVLPYPLRVINDLTYSTTVKHLSSLDIGKARVGLPPLDEQRAIATFLDRETARIDALIAKKERLLALLEEKRTALITRAVTKGLDRAVPMKESGVEWLGEVPADWQVKRLKHVVSLITSGSRGWAEHYSDDGPIFVRIGNLSRSGIDLDLTDLQRVTPPDGAEGARTKVSEGDVLISITAFIGAVGLVPDGFDEAYVNQHIALARPRLSDVDPRWLAYCLLSDVGQVQFALSLYGGTKEGLGLDDVRNLKVLVPPRAEQRAIVQQLDRQTTLLETLRSRARHAIALLREYRTALISAAVTGQIDVSGEVDGGRGDGYEGLKSQLGREAS